MALHDRIYARSDDPDRGYVGPTSRAELTSSPRFWSVNTWLIVINVAIFLGCILFSSAGIPVVRSFAPPQTLKPFTDQGLVESPFFLHPQGFQADRDYLRRAGNPAYTTLVKPGTKDVVVDPATGLPIVAAVYLVQDPLTALGHFSTYQGFQRLQVWRLVTFQFLHANIIHIAFNMFGLYMFGWMVEQYLGRRKYLAFYLACGIFGGVAYLALNLLAIIWTGSLGMKPLPLALVQESTTSLVGASAGVFGVIVACAKIRPNERMMLLFPPVDLPLRLIAYGYVAIAALSLILNHANPASNAGGDAAHLGGAIAGFWLIRRPHLLTDFFDILKDSRKPRKPKLRLADEPQATPQDEIDRILAKVSAQGKESLSDRERDILHEATQRLRGRTG